VWALTTISALLVQVLPAVIITLVPASSGSIRLAALLVVAILTIHVILTIHGVVENFTWRTTLAATTAILAFRSCDVLCLNPLSSKDIPRPVREDEDGVDPRTQGILESEVVSAWRLLWNMRGIQTPRAISNVPPFSASDHSYVPTWTTFLLRNLVSIAVLALTIDFFASQPPANVQTNYSLTKQHLLWRLSEVDSEELLLRIAGTLGFWVNMTCYISVMYSCLAVLFVGLGLDDPIDWPPVYGSLANAWTIRRFWR